MAIWSLKDEKFLVIDDFSEMRAMMRTMLMSYGAQDIHLARNGEDALKILENNQFSIILCDYNLGDGKDGQQVLEEARYRGLLSASLIYIMVTAENTAHMVMGALENQPSSYLSKPINRTVLQARLDSLLKKRARLHNLNQLINKKQYQQAIAACDKEMAESPRYRFELLKLRTELLMELDDYPAVADQAQQVLDERDIPWAFYYKGKASLMLQDYEKAKEIFTQLIETQGNYIVAYDGLAEAEKGLGNNDAAQAVLLQALERSPKSVLRQRNLAETSERIGDYQTSEKARRQAIKVGRKSVLKAPGDYAGLAKALVKNDKSSEALQIASSVQKEFNDSAEAELVGAITTSQVYQSMGKEAESEAALKKSTELLEQFPGGAPRNLSLDVAEACMEHGQVDEAKELIRQVVTEQHNDQSVLARVGEIFKEAGLEEQGRSFIETTREGIIKINNRGVKMASEGDVAGSIVLFDEALLNMPKNTDININAAFAFLKSMQQNGVEQGLLEKTKRCLAVVRQAGDHKAKYQKMMELSQGMEASLTT